MFQLSFAPTFARQRDALLAQATAPPLAIPPRIEERLTAIAQGDGARIPTTAAWPLGSQAVASLAKGQAGCARTTSRSEVWRRAATAGWVERLGWV